MTVTFDTQMIILILGIFFLAGFIKGIVGLGLPTISLALLTVVTNLPTAMVLLIMPSLVTNIWQAVNGPYLKLIVKRFWLFLLACTIFVPFGGKALVLIDLSYLSILLGGLLVSYASIEILGHSLQFPRRVEGFIGSLCGSLTGLLTGMTGSSVVPGALFLQAVGLERDILVQTMGVMFSCTTISLALSLHQNEFLSLENSFWSNLGIIPALIGMIFGKKLRLLLPQEIFKKIFFILIFLLGLYIICQAIYDV